MATVPAAAQVLDVLQYLTGQAGPVPAAAISRDVGLPRSTTYHLLDTLIRSGFVLHLPEERRYGLGLSAYELGSGYSRQAPLQRLARVPVAALVDRTGHTAHLAVLHGRDVVYVIEERAPRSASLVTDVAVRLPAHLTASGRAILARYPNAQLRALFPDPSAFVRRNERGPNSLSALRQLLIETRKRGYAEENSEVSEGFSSVAVAVTDHSGHPVAAVALTFPSASIDPARRRHYAEQVSRTARELSRRLGAVG
jgi:DNA-binding IclR family transcriptional regulator